MKKDPVAKDKTKLKNSTEKQIEKRTEND